MEVGDEMQKIALDSAAYGYRRKAIYIQSLRRRGSLLAGMSTGVEWKSVAGFQEYLKIMLVGLAQKTPLLQRWRTANPASGRLAPSVLARAANRSIPFGSR